MAHLDLIRQLEAATARGWPASHTTQIHGWQVHSGRGYVGRTNSCWPLNHDGSPLEASIDAVEAHYHGLGLAPQFKIAQPVCSHPHLADQLASRGYRVVSEVAVMASTGKPAEPIHRVEISPSVTAAFKALVMGTGATAGDGQERAEIFERLPNPSAFGTIILDAKPVAAGLCSFAGDSAGIAAMRTHADYRNQGLARSVFRAIAGRAYQAGYRLFWLQVETNNGPARHLYEGEGFEEVYRYHTWRLAPT